MTFEATPTITEPGVARFDDGRPGRHSPHPPPRNAVRILIVAVFAVAVGAATYFVSGAISPTYRSSTQLLVNVNESTGLGLDSVSAANQLTAQYVQLVPTDAVLARPAAQLGLSVSDLRNDISAGTVAQENLLQINANGPSASTAQQRAAIVTTDFMSFVARDNRRQLQAYISAVSAQLRSLDNDYAQLAARLRKASAAKAAYIQGELGTLASQQQSLQNQVTQRATAGVPIIQLVRPAGSGSRVAPHPALYAVVGFLVAAFVGAELAIWDYRRRRSAA